MLVKPWDGDILKEALVMRGVVSGRFSLWGRSRGTPSEMEASCLRVPYLETLQGPLPGPENYLIGGSVSHPAWRAEKAMPHAFVALT